MTEFQLQLLTPHGTPIAWLRPGSFSYTKGLNYEGDFALRLLPDFDWKMIQKDQLLRIQRKVSGGVLMLDFVGIIRDWDIEQYEGGYIYTVRGPGMNWLLGGRVVAYAAGSAQAEMSGNADNVMREIVRDNLGADAGSRAIESTVFAVQANNNSGPAVNKAFSYNNVLDVLRELAQGARFDGTPLYFQIEPSSGKVYEFRVNTITLGMDRRSGANKLTFGPEFGNFKNGVLQYRSRQEVNVAYALGQGEGSERRIQTATDTARAGASPWARRETVVNATHLTTDEALLDAANAAVIAGRPVEALSGQLVSTEATQYGRDWNLGYLVRVTFAGKQADAIVRAVTVSVDANGEETVTGQIELL